MASARLSQSRDVCDPMSQFMMSDGIETFPSLRVSFARFGIAMSHIYPARACVV